MYKKRWMFGPPGPNVRPVVECLIGGRILNSTLNTTTVQARDRAALVSGGLIALAAVGWVWSIHESGSMTMSGSMPGSMSMVSTAFAPFILAWVAMMAAMMFPAVQPAVRLFGLASGRGQAVATPFFVSGYIAVWTLAGIPAYVAWKSLMGPLSDGRAWTGYLAGGVLTACALYQVSPLKQACLKHCRSPMSFFLRQRYNLKRPDGAARAGALHGCVCLGCCWAEMAVLVAMGTMSLAWMVGLAVLIFAEKASPFGGRASVVSAMAMAGLAAVLFANPHFIVHIT